MTTIPASLRPLSREGGRGKGKRKGLTPSPKVKKNRLGNRKRKNELIPEIETESAGNTPPVAETSLLTSQQTL